MTHNASGAAWNDGAHSVTAIAVGFTTPRLAIIKSKLVRTMWIIHYEST